MIDDEEWRNTLVHYADILENTLVHYHLTFYSILQLPAPWNVNTSPFSSHDFSKLLFIQRSKLD